MGERFLFAPFEMMRLGGVRHHRQFLTLLGSLGGLVLEAGPGELMEEGVHSERVAQNHTPSVKVCCWEAPAKTESFGDSDRAMREFRASHPDNGVLVVNCFAKETSWNQQVAASM